MFDFYMNTRVKFGVGVRNSLVDILKAEDWTKIGLVVDHNLKSVPMIKVLIESLQVSFDKTVVAYCEMAEPSYEYLEKIRGTFTGDLRAIIGIGGGSALDAAKAMAVLSTNKGSSIQYRGFNKMTEAVLPVIAIPTTAGTGSEVTPNASFVSEAEKVKMGINGESVRPCFAFLDPELTLSCPLKASMSAALDSVVHATEAFIAKKSNPMARFFAKEGCNLVLENLPIVMADLNNISARTQVMYGAFLSGIALMNSGTGPAAALSYPLGTHYKVPHGLAGAVFLPHVVALNVEAGTTAYGAMLRDGKDCIEDARRFSQKLFDCWRGMGAPLTINQVVSGLDHDVMVKDTLVLKAALEQNPVEFGEAEILSVLKRAS